MALDYTLTIPEQIRRGSLYVAIPRGIMGASKLLEQVSMSNLVRKKSALQCRYRYPVRDRGGLTPPDNASAATRFSLRLLA